MSDFEIEIEVWNRSPFLTMLSIPWWRPKGLTKDSLTAMLPEDGFKLGQWDTLSQSSPLTQGGHSHWPSSSPGGLESSLFLLHRLCCGSCYPALDSCPLSRFMVESVRLLSLHIIDLYFIFCLNWTVLWNEELWLLIPFLSMYVSSSFPNFLKTTSILSYSF